MTAADLPLHVERTTHDGHVLLQVGGEIDMATAPVLRAALAEAEGRRAVVLDLSAVDFMDSSGLQVLVRAHVSLGEEGRRLVIVCPHGAVRRVLALTGVDERLDLRPSLRGALEGLVPDSA